MTGTASLELFLLAAWGAWVSLDERVVGRRAFTSPLVAGGVAGLLVGAPAAGLALGMLVQLVWPTPIWSGGHLSPSGGIAAVAGVAVLATTLADPGLPPAWSALVPGQEPAAHGGTGTSSPGPDLVWWFAFLTALLTAGAAAVWERHLRTKNRQLDRDVRNALLESRAWGKPLRRAWWGAVLRGAVLVSFASIAGLAVAQLEGIRILADLLAAPSGGPAEAGLADRVSRSAIPTPAAALRASLLWLPLLCLAAGWPQAWGRLGAGGRASLLQWTGGAIAGGLLVWVGHLR